MVVCTLGERKLAGWGLAFGRNSGHDQGPLRLCAAPTAAEVARIAEAAVQYGWVHPRVTLDPVDLVGEGAVEDAGIVGADGHVDF